MKKVLWKSGLGFILVLTLTLTTPLRAAEYFVTIYNSFNPSSLQIQFGDTVTWINQDPFFPHTVKSDTGAWTTGFLFEEDATFSLTFNALGTFPYRDDGSFATGTITVVGGNSPPSVIITNLTEGAVFSAPATFSIQADASDSDGSVVSVEFFVGETSIGIDTTSNPFSATASNLFAGDYVISAIATDNLGAIASSTLISISVTNPIISLGAPKILNGQFQFLISGLVAGKTNLVQSSTNLVDWVPVRTNLATSSSSAFTNTQTAGSVPKYFQVIQLP